MTKRGAALILVALCICSAAAFSAPKDATPEQIATAMTGIAETPIIVTWVTFSPTNSSQVQYWLSGSDPSTNTTAVGSSKTFLDNGPAKVVRYIHRVMLKIAFSTAHQDYSYRCGSPDSWSEVKSLKVLDTSETSSPTFAVYGDLGWENSRSVPYIIKDVEDGRIDGVLHCGDLAYDLYENDGKNGDYFMNQIEPIASKIPYMVAPGNHENHDNFTHYRKRFSMPGNKENLYYSWDVGPAHLISIDSEFYFFVEDGLGLISEQYRWLGADLKQANQPDRRAKHPWIIIMYHRPMYCSTDDEDDCTHHESIVRVGLPILHSYGLEKLLYDYGVDIIIEGHEHVYERLWPIYDFQVKNGSYEEPYTNPGAPVHIITGAAGCREKTDGFKRDQPDWVAFASDSYGYTRMTLHNSTHVSLQQIGVDQGGDVIDEITVIKDKHGPYN